jgi:AcrR family transcriptional regulator
MRDQREKILGCACDLYLKHGLDGFSMRKLAREVGVTAPALYRHYASRDHVLADVVREAYREFAGALSRALEGRTALERMVRASEGYLDVALKHPRWYQLLFIAPEQLGLEAIPEDIEAMGCGVHQFWVDRVRESQDAGILRQGDPAAISTTMWAHAHGMLSLYHHGHFGTEEEAFRRQYEASVRRVLAGVGSQEFTSHGFASHDADEPVGANA